MINDSVYEIDLSSIWKWEREQFLSGKTTSQFADSFLSNIEVEIVNKSEPVLALANYEEFDESEKAYYDRKFNEYKVSLKDIKLIYQNEFFFNNRGYYTFDMEIFIAKSHPNFMYWFVLNLRHFQREVSELKSYLDYQFENNFNGNIDKYGIFLDALIIQHKVLLEGIIYDGISSWLREKRKVESIYYSYKLKSSDLIIKNHQIFHNCYISLIEHSYIGRNTSFENFKEIFNSERRSKIKKIVWVANAVELKHFIDSLYKINVVIGPREKYKVAVNCFVKANSDEFLHGQIYGARSLKEAKRNEIENILSKLIKCKYQKQTYNLLRVYSMLGFF